MNRKFLFLICVAIFSIEVNHTAAQVLLPFAKDTKQIVSLNGTWKFKYLSSTKLSSDSLFYKPDFNISNWASIKVPGNWEMQGFAESEYKKLKDALGLYKTQFNVPAN